MLSRLFGQHFTRYRYEDVSVLQFDCDEFRGVCRLIQNVFERDSKEEEGKDEEGKNKSVKNHNELLIFYDCSQEKCALPIAYCALSALGDFFLPVDDAAVQLLSPNRYPLQWYWCLECSV